MATIKRRSDRGGQWEVRYRDPEGKQRAKLCRTKVDAERFVATTTADIVRGTYIDPGAGRVTLADYASEWLARMGPTWRVSTAAGIANSLEHHVLPVLGRRLVASLRKSDVEALCASLRLAPSTVATIHQHLGQMLASASRTASLPANQRRALGCRSGRHQRHSRSRSRSSSGFRPGYRNGWRWPFLSASAPGSDRARRAA